MDIIILRFDAPLMSFGGVIVDQHGVIDRFPGLSFLAGLLGNALGYSHGDFALLDSLQRRIEYAARWDVPPEKLVDYHTVDLGQEKMKENGWTTRGQPEHRAGGSAKFGTHQRYRHYWANGLMTVAVTLSQDEKPSVLDLFAALLEPARPLFLGRKTCLPSAPIALDKVFEVDVFDALQNVPPLMRGRSNRNNMLEACWPERLLNKSAQSHKVHTFDTRDWKSQLHVGSRTQIHGMMEVAP